MDVLKNLLITLIIAALASFGTVFLYHNFIENNENEAKEMSQSIENILNHLDSNDLKLERLSASIASLEKQLKDVDSMLYKSTQNIAENTKRIDNIGFKSEEIEFNFTKFKAEYEKWKENILSKKKVSAKETKEKKEPVKPKDKLSILSINKFGNRKIVGVFVNEEWKGFYGEGDSISKNLHVLKIEDSKAIFKSLNGMIIERYL